MSLQYVTLKRECLGLTLEGFQWFHSFVFFFSHHQLQREGGEGGRGRKGEGGREGRERESIMLGDKGLNQEIE